MHTRRHFVVAMVATLFGTTAVSGQRRAAPDLFDGFDRWVTEFIAEWHIPGLALGVIKDGMIVTTRAYGYRDVENELPMTPATVLPIGSATKSFTAVLLGMLADEQRLDWDRPVRNYLPDWQLHDPYATEHITPRDLLSHRSGLPAHDNVWYGRAITRPELMRRLQYLEPSTSFRNRYQYNNLMFAAAGYLAERITDTSWDRLVRERIFGPLGMTQSNTSIRDLPALPNVALPYRWADGRLEKLVYRNLDAAAPAGAINSSVDDMLKYLRFRLDLGTVGEQRLVSRAVLELMETPHTPLGTNELFDLTSYGLGVQLSAGMGHPEVSHAGGIDGFSANMAWFPSDRLGIIVLTNGSDAVVPAIVKRDVRDRVLGLPRVDRAPLLRQARQEAARAAAAAAPVRPTAGTAPSHALRAYTGSYHHPGYGTMTIRGNGTDLELTYDEVVLGLRHYHYDIFELAPPPGRVTLVRGLVRFETDAAGNVRTLRIPFERSLPDIAFTRRE